MFMDSSDETLAEKLKREDPEQFHTLVRMHLSFVLDLNTDETDCVEEKSKLRTLKWTFAKKVKCLAKGVMEGAPLTQEGICQVYQLIEYLSLEENIIQEGIFRRTGKLTRQQELKSLLNQGTTLNLHKSQFSVHDCASVLKSFLAELPEPLLTEAHLPAYCQLAELCTSPCNEAKLLRALQLLLLLLPSENCVLLRDLLQLLHLTASHEMSNKMSAHNLATLFTPHLLCPRRLTPEAFHANSQTMSRVVAFMIRTGTDLLRIPPKLATDIRAYWTKKESRRQLTPQKELDESIDGTTTAATVFTFLDQENTSKVYNSNTTESALAELYAHVQSLPESSHKRKLIKQYNKGNGNGTPVQNKHLRTKSLGDSIKKHIFNKNAKQHRNQNGEGQFNITCSASQEKMHRNNPETILTKTTMFPKSLKSEGFEVSNCMEKSVDVKSPAVNCLQTSILNNLSITLDNDGNDTRFTSHIGKNTEEVSPCKHQTSLSSDEEFESSSSPTKSPRYTASLSPDLAQHTPIGQSTASRHEDAGTDHCSSPALPRSPLSRSALPGFFTPLAPPLGNANTNKPGLTPRNAWSTFLTTSTPAPILREADASCLFTPIADDNNSMSPITRSTQRMPRAMQETMMTPRSRKPVLALSGTNICHLANFSSSVSPEDFFDTGRTKGLHENKISTKVELSAGCIQEPKLSTIGENSPQELESTTSNELGERSKECSSGDSLTSTFRSYLFSRSVLTASPVDLSFSSRTGDFDTGTSSEIDVDMTKDELTDSLLYCLDGNQPQTDTSKTKSEGSDCSSASNSIEKDLCMSRKRSVDSKATPGHNITNKTIKHGKNDYSIDKYLPTTVLLGPKLISHTIVHETSL